jgi:hypothetical protein
MSAQSPLPAIRITEGREWTTLRIIIGGYWASTWTMRG